MINISFIKLNTQLIEILGDYIFGYNALKECIVKYQNKEVAINEETAKNLRYNNYLEVSHGNKKIVCELLTISMDKIVFTVKESDLILKEDMKLSCKLYFHLYRFILNGKIESIDSAGSGIQKVNYSYGFSPELTEILDDYFYRIQYVD